MRPTGLTAVCLIAMALGVLGGFSLFTSIVATFLQPAILDFTEWMQAKIMSVQPAQMQQQFAQQMASQKQMMQEMIAIQRGWMLYLVAGLVVLAATATALIVGGIKGLRLRPRAHYWMIAGFSAGILHALISTFVGIAIQRESEPITMKYVNQSMQTNPAMANPAARAMMTNASQAGATIGYAFLFGWALLKCGAYATCIGYLLTPRNRRLFEGDGSERAIIDALSDKPT